MPLKLVRRSGTDNWYIRGSVRGQRVFETAGTDDAEIANAVRIKREAALLERSVFGPGATVSFAEAAASYLDDGGEPRFLGHYDEKSGRWTLLIGHFDKRVIATIGQAEIDEAARVIYPRAKAATRKRQVYVPMAAVLNHAARKGWAPPPPRLKHPRVPPSQTTYSTPARIETLLPHCSAPLRRLVLFLAYTGARISEALRVEWKRDVALAERTVVLRRTKNGKMRTVKISDTLLVELSRVPEAERAGRLFHWKARGAIYKPLRNACKRAGVDYLPPHQQGRHTFGSWLRIHAGRDLRGIMEDGGWDSPQSVMRYLHVAPGETAAAIDKLPGVQNVSSPAEATAKRRKRIAISK